MLYCTLVIRSPKNWVQCLGFSTESACNPPTCYQYWPFLQVPWLEALVMKRVEKVRRVVGLGRRVLVYIISTSLFGFSSTRRYHVSVMVLWCHLYYRPSQLGSHCPVVSYRQIEPKSDLLREIIYSEARKDIIVSECIDHLACTGNSVKIMILHHPGYVPSNSSSCRWTLHEASGVVTLVGRQCDQCVWERERMCWGPLYDNNWSKNSSISFAVGVSLVIIWIPIPLKEFSSTSWFHVRGDMLDALSLPVSLFPCKWPLASDGIGWRRTSLGDYVLSNPVFSLLEVFEALSWRIFHLR